MFIRHYITVCKNVCWQDCYLVTTRLLSGTTRLLFVCLLSRLRLNGEGLPSILYGSQGTSLPHYFGVMHDDKTSTGFSVDLGYPSIGSSSLITSQGELVITASCPLCFNLQSLLQDLHIYQEHQSKASKGLQCIVNFEFCLHWHNKSQYFLFFFYY